MRFTCLVNSSAIVLPLLKTTLFSRDTVPLPPAELTPSLNVLFLVAPSLILSKTPAYSMSAPNTNRTHTITHASIAVSPDRQKGIFVQKYLFDQQKVIP